MGSIRCTGSQTAIGFVWAKIKGVYVWSFYAPPSLTLSELERMLDSPVFDARCRSPKVIAGDFYAWTREWDGRKINAKFRSLLDALAQLDIILVNEGYVSTFLKGGVCLNGRVNFCQPCTGTWYVLVRQQGLLPQQSSGNLLWAMAAGQKSMVTG